MITIDNVTKRYGKPGSESCVTALDEVSEVISNGEFIGIIGESGSGKSTLLNIIGALDTPTSGSVIIDDDVISSFNENRSAKFRLENIGFIFQNFYLDPDFNVLQNVEIPLILKGVDKPERKEIAEKMLTRLGLKEKLTAKVTELSGGQRQKVCIARALVNDPKIVLADEPTGNLDSVNGLMVVNLLKEISRNGITVILVTHNLTEAALCDRLITLKDGKIVKP